MDESTGAPAPLSRSDILAASDLAIELVPVPEWGGFVYVRGLTGTERDSFEGSLLMRDEKGRQAIRYDNVRAKLAARTVCDASGKRLFSDADIPELAKKSAAALARVFEVAQRLSGLGAEDVQELLAGLKNDPSADSTSG